LNDRRFACAWWKVPSIDESILYVRRCFQIQRGTYAFHLHLECFMCRVMPTLRCPLFWEHSRLRAWHDKKST
jgi:hypothetical protein